MRNVQIVFVLLVFSAAGVCADAVPFIEEGFFLEGAEGLLVKDPTVDAWSFIPDEAIKITKTKTFPAGQQLPMLPCSVLEQMARMAEKEEQLRVQLWALCTQYKQMNYLFSVFFLPVNEGTSSSQSPDEPKEAGGSDDVPGSAQTSESVIPSDILSQIRQSKTPDLQKFEQIAQVSGDMNLIDRAGYLIEQNRVRIFQPDGFGMNVNRNQYSLLPNQMRSDAEKEMAKTPGRQRFTVSGLVTTYKGQTYILLRRAVRTYTNGNFTN